MSKAYKLYNEHKKRAKYRGIEFHFVFEEWVLWWFQHLGRNWMIQRGRKRGQYVMARRGDKGPYTSKNVKCIMCQENIQEKRNPSKITEDQAREIRESCLSAQILARQYNLTVRHVRRIKRGVVWKKLCGRSYLMGKKHG